MTQQLQVNLVST